MSRPLLLAVSHGTADAAGSRAIAALVDSARQSLPDVDVRAAFVDVQEPDAAELAPRLGGRVVIVPLLLSSGFHVHHDLHGIAARRPRTVVADPLGPDPRLAEVLASRLDALHEHAPEHDERKHEGHEHEPEHEPEREPGGDHKRHEPEPEPEPEHDERDHKRHEPEPEPERDRQEQKRHAPVILAVAGSRDERSLTDAEAMASLLAARTGRDIHLAYLAARRPSLPTALAEHPDAVVSTFLLARGYFFDLASRQAAGRMLTAPLLDGGEVPPALTDLVISRYLDAAARL
ncbi:sirohydrochlorin chelatase [Microbacterium sp. XT11]|uniref:sirohydrochlorin chelatase n=1 Tax=Microbacterium sp. XT11 TaxID=367477 RepID=UPI0009F867ED|nr:CbiX/SirB N-terminal domain-containing protein [Microbacterium sp. XT11]